jgi:hypothetical protein
MDSCMKLKSEPYFKPLVAELTRFLIFSNAFAISTSSAPRRALLAVRAHLRVCRRKRSAILMRLPSSHAHNPHTPAIYTRPQHSGARNPQTLPSSHARSPHAPAIFTRPPSSHTPRPGSDDSSHRFFVQQVAILIGGGAGGGGGEIVYGLLPSRRPL